MRVFNTRYIEIIARSSLTKQSQKFILGISSFATISDRKTSAPSTVTRYSPTNCVFSGAGCRAVYIEIIACNSLTRQSQKFILGISSFATISDRKTSAPSTVTRYSPTNCVFSGAGCRAAT
ncbi:MAG: hypothetical protein ACI4JT_06295 [Oscillospiraceae bacterium]